MFISARKLTDKESDRYYYFNPDQIISISPGAFESGYRSTVYFVDGKQLITRKSVKQICEILTDCSVEVWR